MPCDAPAPPLCSPTTPESVHNRFIFIPDPDKLSFYMTPLSLAIIEDQFENFNLLLSQGASVNLELCGGTPMKYAIKYGRLDMLERLHKEGGDFKPEYLEVAISERQVECARFFLEHCPSDMKNDMINNENYMYNALLYNSVELARLLKQHGWHYDVKSEEQEPVMIELAKYDAHKIVKELGESGSVDFNVRDKFGMTPLLWCADYMVSETTMKEILTHGASVNQGCRLDNETALYRCAQKGNLEKVKILVRSGADPNLKNRYGESPVDVASRCGYDKIVEYLLETGAVFNGDTSQRRNVADVINVYKTSVKSLQHLARLCIRFRLFQNQNASKIEMLPLPKSVKRYLSFDNFDNNNTVSNEFA